jgi:uncharacterized protein YgiM (DUF1202 family)
MCILAGLAAAQATTRWVERTKADVRAGRGSYFDVVDTVIKGEKVEVRSSQERWLMVQTPRGKSGWMFEAALSSTAVSPGSSNFLKLVPGDASTSATAASSGAKGIYAQDYAKQKGYDYTVVTWIEQNQPAATDIEAFVRDGGLEPPGGAR